MKSKNWLLWISFYALLIAIAIGWHHGDPYAAMAFKGVIWVRLCIVVWIAAMYTDPYRAVEPEPRSAEFTACYVICEGAVWLVLLFNGLITELIVTWLAMSLYESCRYEAIHSNDR